MVLKIILMFLSTVLQNASFTLVSRARNTNSILFHGVASVFSNGIWLLVISQVVTQLDNKILMVTYVAGSVTGSLLMHYFSMNYLEKWFKAKMK